MHTYNVFVSCRCMMLSSASHRRLSLHILSFSNGDEMEVSACSSKPAAHETDTKGIEKLRVSKAYEIESGEKVRAVDGKSASQLR